jgi:hypothetical protein
MRFLDNIKEHWITWRTGSNRNQREWKAWYNANVNWRATDITNMFENFKHVIEVDPDKFLWDGGLTWVPHPDALQYFWPQRPLGENSVWRIERVLWNTWENRWNINEIGGEDRVFVATNSDEDAIMIALKRS